MPYSFLQKRSSVGLKSIVNNHGSKTGFSMPAVPILQHKIVQKKDLEKELPLQGKFAIQKKTPEEEELAVQGKFTVQKQGLEEEETVQAKFALSTNTSANLQAQPLQKFSLTGHPIQRKENNTGLPDNLKSGVENLSGFSMDDVKVHYNSDKPAQLQALAYAQGTDIHVAPGQEKHLPHEAWHVAQQKQGRVQPTMQMKQGVPVNDDKVLENEADVMGAKAMQFVADSTTIIDNQPAEGANILQAKA
jgi:hypothetical protein